MWLRNHLKEKLNERGKRLTLANLPGNTITSFLGPGIHVSLLLSSDRLVKGRFDDAFIEERRKGLEEFLNSVVNHPFSRFEKALQDFLQDQDAKVFPLLYSSFFSFFYSLNKCRCYLSMYQSQ